MDDEWIPDTEVDAVMGASRALIAVAARSMVEIDDAMTPLQWRVLVLISTKGPRTPGLIAEDLGVHASNATRICDRLVRADFIGKTPHPDDRRFQQLALTGKGESLVARIMARRRSIILDIMRLMPASERSALSAALGAFAEAAGELPVHPVPGVFGLGA